VVSVRNVGNCACAAIDINKMKAAAMRLSMPKAKFTLRRNSHGRKARPACRDRVQRAAFEPAQLDGRFHEIVVKSRGADHRIRARSDYFAGK
jgi:hypothetical protein